MQIRIANRQDEKKIVEFIEQIFIGSDLKLDLNSKDADLKNLEANYFGRDGVFLLAEHEEKIVGIAAANMVDEHTCALRRIYVLDEFRRRGIAGKLLSIVVSAAKRLDYKWIVADESSCPGTRSADASNRNILNQFLESSSFKNSAKGDAGKSYCLDLILT